MVHGLWSISRSDLWVLDRVYACCGLYSAAGQHKVATSCVLTHLYGSGIDFVQWLSLVERCPGGEYGFPSGGLAIFMYRSHQGFSCDRCGLCLSYAESVIHYGVDDHRGVHQL